MRFNPEDFKAQKECAICMESFGEDDEVTPLPCNGKHYFHTACISEWLKTNATCPLCREPVNASGFQALEARLAEHA